MSVMTFCVSYLWSGSLSSSCDMALAWWKHKHCLDELRRCSTASVSSPDPILKYPNLVNAKLPTSKQIRVFELLESLSDLNLEAFLLAIFKGSCLFIVSLPTTVSLFTWSGQWDNLFNLLMAGGGWNHSHQMSLLIEFSQVDQIGNCGVIMPGHILYTFVC